MTRPDHHAPTRLRARDQLDGARTPLAPLVRSVALVLAVVAAAAAVAWWATAPARSDALCDAMKARFGPGYPCLNVPTNTFTPTAPTAPTTQGSTGQNGGGPQAGSNIGPGPGEGNGTPIVPVPGQGQQTPTTAPLPGVRTAPTQAVPGPTNSPTVPPRPSRPSAPSSTPSAAAPTSSAVPQDETGTPAPAPTQTASTGDDTTGAGTQTALWLLAGAAALVAGASSTRTRVGGYRALAAANGYPSVGAALRSWLPRGGSERAAIGGSQYVLINDPTSPREYVFHENVPPGGHIAVNPDGSATIYDRDGRAVSTIAKPWAYDALGRPQRTWYTVDNNGDLVQHVDPAPDAVYPILADPPDPRIKQQQAAAAQGTSAHRTGTGTPLNKSPKADPPPPPANPPANAPDYGGAPHNQAPTHSGLPPSQTAPELQTSSPDGNGSSANPGLQNALTGPIDNTPQPEATSPTQGAQPAPGQNLSYSDFLNNQLGGQTVGTVQQRPGPDGTTQYFRTDPGGAEYTAVAAGPSGGGGMTFVFNDGSIFDSEVVDGVSSLTRVDSEGTRTTEFSNGERVVIRRDGSGEWTPPPADANGSVLSAMLEGTGRLIDKAAAGVQPARHALNAAEAAEVAEWLGRFSRTLGPVGIGVSIADGGVHIADGAPVPETIGSTSGGIAGAALGATTGASIGSFIPGPGTFVGAVIGAGVGAFVGSTYGARVGHGARVVWRKLFG